MSRERPSPSDVPDAGSDSVSAPADPDAPPEPVGLATDPLMMDSVTASEVIDAVVRDFDPSGPPV